VKKHKKAKSKSKKTSAGKKAVVSHQAKVDQLQTQLNDTQRRLDSVLRTYGDGALLDYIVRSTEHVVENLTCDWAPQTSGVSKQALYYKSAKLGNETLLAILKKAVKQRISIAKLYCP
jgi:hypothetical protein